LPVGPAMPDSQELIDISGEKMKVVAAFPSLPEPHDAVFISRQALADKVAQTYEISPTATKLGEEKIVRNGSQVDVYMTCIRSKFIPEQVEVHEGDRVNIHLTNVETVRNMTHGFALADHGINIAVDPGQTQVVPLIAGKPGTYWYYCTWFCSALHLEMRGRLLVKPIGAPVSDSIVLEARPRAQGADKKAAKTDYE